MTVVLLLLARPLLGVTLGAGTAAAAVAAVVVGAVAAYEAAARRDRSSHVRPMRWLWRGSAVAAAVTVLAGTGMGVMFAATPGVGDAEARVRARASAHHSAARTPVSAPRVAAALVAAEDARFYTDPGIDVRGAARATAAWLRGVGDAGGSTLEEQLARMLYVKGRSSRAVQLEQVALGMKLARQWPKSAILRMYLASAYYGHGYYGIGAAAAGYFHTAPGRLDWPQAALLAGLVEAPGTYDPLRHPALAVKRRAYVLRRLGATGALTHGQVRRYASAPLELASFSLAPVTDQAPAHR